MKTLETFEVEQTYLAQSVLNRNERCRIRRRQQGFNVSFQHQAGHLALREGAS